MSKEEPKLKIKQLIAQAEGLIPETLQDNLPDIANIPGVPEWHNYERKIWELGELIRQELAVHKNLRKDKELMDLFLRISLNRNAKRGRQSFIILFWNKHCREYAPQLITQIQDEFVCGHIIEGLNKMHAEGFSEMIREFTQCKVSWIRNQAKKYLATHAK
jgi:hypothetical protein